MAERETSNISSGGVWHECSIVAPTHVHHTKQLPIGGDPNERGYADSDRACPAAGQFLFEQFDRPDSWQSTHAARASPVFQHRRPAAGGLAVGCEGAGAGISEGPKFSVQWAGLGGLAT